MSDGTPSDAGSRRIRTYAELGGDDRSDLPGQMAQLRARVERRMERVDAVVGVMSGKGGVGKSFVATGLAVALAAEGWRVGVVDADLEAPTAARTLGAEPTGLPVTEEGVEPVPTTSGVRLVSTALLVAEDAPVRWSGPVEEAHVWRGLQERQVLREFLSDVTWGDLDLLVVDLPPGLARLEQLLGLVPDLTGLLAVTVPSAVAGSAVERALAVATDREAPILGVVENMAGYVCPSCGETGGLFEGTAGLDLAERFSLEMLGRVPFDQRSAVLADAGEPGRLLGTTRAGTALRSVAVGLAVALRNASVAPPPSIEETTSP